MRDRFHHDGGAIRLIPGLEDFSARLAAMPSAETADQAAIDAAQRNGYLIRERSDGVDRRAAGRELSSRALVDTGVAALLLSGDVFDVAVLAAELATYLAGPVVPVWDYAIINADLALSAPVPVVDGWELLTPTAAELTSLVGVPSAARHVATRLSFDFDLYGGLPMLRRIDPDGKPHSGLVLYWNVRPAHSLWLPLLALSLYDNAVIELWAQYDVEPGRRVDVMFDHVYTEPWTPDGVTEIEVVRTGDFELAASDEPRFRRFLAQLSALFGTALAQPTTPTKRSEERAAQLRRVGEHFLTAGEHAHGEGEVLSEHNADAVLHYVIALEALLTRGDTDKSDLARKVSQRAAVLAGTDDADRRHVAEAVRAAYAARSVYAHGGEPKDVALPALRRVVRDCIVARLVLGDPSADDRVALAARADQALVDHGCLADHVREPVARFWAAVDSG